MTPPNWLKHLFTEANNEVWDLKRVGWGVVAALWGALGGYAVVALHQAFDWQAAALGGSALIGSLGAAIGMAKGGESTPKDGQ